MPENKTACWSGIYQSDRRSGSEAILLFSAGEMDNIDPIVPFRGTAFLGRIRYKDDNKVVIVGPTRLNCINKAMDSILEQVVWFSDRLNCTDIPGPCTVVECQRFIPDKTLAFDVGFAVFSAGLHIKGVFLRVVREQLDALAVCHDFG